MYYSSPLGGIKTICFETRRKSNEEHARISRLVRFCIILKARNINQGLKEKRNNIYIKN